MGHPDLLLAAAIEETANLMLVGWRRAEVLAAAKRLRELAGVTTEADRQEAENGQRRGQPETGAD